MRINKYIAQAGIASRRTADMLVEQGKVSVNGTVLTTPGYQVISGDVVAVEGKIIKPDEEKIYLLLNKPFGIITSVKDDRNRTTVIDLLKENPDIATDCKGIFPVGRLDYNTRGLLLLTNDGELTYRMTHPKHNFPKTYRALVQGELSRERQLRLIRGVDIGGFVTSGAQVKVVNRRRNTTLVDITIHEGKNRQVRKMFSAVGNPVQELTRISMGDIFLGHLREGAFRKLTAKEISYLKEI